MWKHGKRGLIRDSWVPEMTLQLWKIFGYMHIKSALLQFSTVPVVHHFPSVQQLWQGLLGVNICVTEISKHLNQSWNFLTFMLYACRKEKFISWRECCWTAVTQVWPYAALRANLSRTFAYITVQVKVAAHNFFRLSFHCQVFSVPFHDD